MFKFAPAFCSLQLLLPSYYIKTFPSKFYASLQLWTLYFHIPWRIIFILQLLNLYNCNACWYAQYMYILHNVNTMQMYYSLIHFIASYIVYMITKDKYILLLFSPIFFLAILFSILTYYASRFCLKFHFFLKVKL